jgi:hypothetical protein
MKETTVAGNALDFLTRYRVVVATALQSYAERMDKAAAEAQTGYDSVKDDPAKRAAQDQALITTDGLKTAAEMFTANAATAHAAQDHLDKEDTETGYLRTDSTAC